MRNHSESVTVLMPVYNAGVYLEPAVESIRRQTHRDFEFLIIDNGSTDGSGETLQGIAAQDPRIRLIRQEHEGLTAVRSRGLALASGTVVVIMDADDLAMPERIERQLAFLADRPEVVAVGTATRLVDKDGRPIAPAKYPLTSQEIVKSLLEGKCAVPHQATAMRREAVLAAGGYRSLFQYAEDFDLWLRLSERHALANLPDVLLDYRWHGDNWSIRRRRELALAMHIAKLAGVERRLGRPDPTIGLDQLCLSDLDRFDLPPDERAAILLDLSEAGLIAYNATGEARYLAEVEETLFAHGHPRDARAGRVAAELGRHLEKAGERRRSAAAIGWKARSETSSVSRRMREVANRHRPHPGAPRRRISLVMYSTPGISEYATLAAEINKRFADRHGYDFIHKVYTHDIEMPAWEKVRLIRDLLPQYDAIFYIDSDAIFNLQAKSLDFLSADNAEFAACSDHPNGPYLANAGAVFIRNTPWARDFVERWWSMRQDPTYHSWAYDQSAMDALLRADTSSRVRIYPATAFNSIAHEIKQGRRDTFVLHFMATTAEFRRAELVHWLRQSAREEAAKPAPSPDKLRVRDLDRFDLPPQERAATLLDLSEARLVAYNATGEARYLADVEETLFAQGHPRGARARTVAARLVRHLWKAGERRRSIAVVLWKFRAEMSSIGRRATPLLEMANRDRRRVIGEWLVHCADPLGPRTAPPRRLLSPQEARELVAQADMHGVLPAVLRQFPPFQGDAAFAGVKADGLARHRSMLTYSLMLRTHGDAVMTAAAGLPVAMVKGPVFARTIYPASGLRNFTDIDLLIAPEAEPQLARVLDSQGFRLAEYDRDPDRQEWKWLHRDNDALMIEVHTNLVHHPELRAAMSLSFQDLAGIAETPAALLTVAAVHGALHRFEQLRHVVDICQAARLVNTAEEEHRFEALMQRSGGRFAAIAGLDLAYRLFAEPRCRELARGLGPARYTALARLLIGRSVVTSTMSSARVLHSWRRQGFRVLLKRRRLGQAAAQTQHSNGG